MVANDRQQSWSEYLDKEKENKLFVRFVFSPDFKEVEEFAVIYLTTVGDEICEVIRFDCSEREAVNVHQFFHKPPKKIYLKREKCYETLEEFMEDIRKKWAVYRSKFLEK
ncbi:MAG: hypothetical protein V1494_06185 [Candidatus Diapherotrites archaeon]